MDFFEAQARARRRTGRLVCLFALAVAGTVIAGYAVASALVRQGGLAWDPQLFAGVAAGTIAIVTIGAAVKWAQYSRGGGSVAETLGGRRIDPGTTVPSERRLLNVVEEMAIASGMPVPAAYVLDDETAINAFAAGLSTSDAVVAVTRGTLEKLSRGELQGVIGHEFSHILNGDMRLNMRIGALIFGILVIGLAGRIVLQGLGRSRIRVSSRGKKGDNGVVLILAIGLGLLVVGYTGYFFGRLIQAAVSRQREFLADASAVQFTRNPAGIVDALRKIGGYALGSSLQTTKSEAVGHFFFAQAFRSSFGGLWATHPPLPERIRAIDPAFDGTYFEPQEVVDVASEPWTRERAPGDAVGFAPGAMRASAPQTPSSTIARAGTLDIDLMEDAAALIAGIPPHLREAAHSQGAAPALVYGILLSRDEQLRAAQIDLVARHAGPEARVALQALDPALASLQLEQRLPLLQLALPSLRYLPAASLQVFFGTLDELVHADRSVSTFEFALQKLVLHALVTAREKRARIIDIHSFNAVAGDIATVLSALARAGGAGENAAVAFAAGAAQLPLLQGRLSFLDTDAAGISRLDEALDRLARASPAIKQRTLLAAAHAVASDGVIHIAESELLRAIAATLDVPLPAPQRRPEAAVQKI